MTKNDAIVETEDVCREAFRITEPYRARQKKFSNVAYVSVSLLVSIVVVALFGGFSDGVLKGLGISAFLALIIGGGLKESITGASFVEGMVGEFVSSSFVFDKKNELEAIISKFEGISSGKFEVAEIKHFGEALAFGDGKISTRELGDTLIHGLGFVLCEKNGDSIRSWRPTEI